MTTTALIPPFDRILIRQHAPEGVTAFGLVLPEGAQEPPLRGTVVAVGEGRRLPTGELEPWPMEVGDFVLIPRYGGTEIEYFEDEGPVISILATEVLAIMRVAIGQACRQCGCTDEEACPGGCSWAEPDLCSRCAGR